MTFLEAIEEMKKGKRVSNTAEPNKIYHIVGGTIEEWDVDDVISIDADELRAQWYLFEEKPVYDLTFVEAMKAVFDGHTVESEVCNKYPDCKDSFRLRLLDNTFLSGHNNAYSFDSRENEGLWRIIK